jgi:membrane protein YdbS with pleckstrin-like domain
MASYCHDCGTELPRRARFCSACGVATPTPQGYVTRATQHDAKRPAAGPAEQVIWRGCIAWRALLPQTLLALVLAIVWSWYASALQPLAPRNVLLGLAMISLVWSTYVLFRRWDESFVLTSHRLMHEVGILRRTTNFLEVIDIDDVGVEQSIWDRLLGIGNIVVVSTDNSHPWLVLKGIFPAREVARLIDDTRHRERLARGLHVEAI